MDTGNMIHGNATIHGLTYAEEDLYNKPLLSKTENSLN